MLLNLYINNLNHHRKNDEVNLDSGQMQIMETTNVHQSTEYTSCYPK